jgi:hypothetical protein
MSRAPALAIVAALMLGVAACDTADDSSDTDEPATETSEPSVAYKLAAIHGDLGGGGLPGCTRLHQG